MTTNDFLILVHELDFSASRHLFENVHSHYYETDIYLDQDVLLHHIELEVRIYGRFTKDGFNLNGIALIDFNLWKNEDKEVKVSAHRKMRAVKIIRQKIIDLTN